MLKGHLASSVGAGELVRLPSGRDALSRRRAVEAGLDASVELLDP